MVKVERAILKTLVYHDIFDFPLTEKELWKFLITDGLRINKKSFVHTLKTSKNIVQKNGFYALRKRQQIVKLRKQREQENRKKYKIAEHVVGFLRNVPTVQLIGISGSLAMHNATKKDDIDLFIIAEKKTLWITRLLLLIILEVLGVRRKRNQNHTQDTVCLNLLVTTDNLSIPKKRQDVFTAHEIVQMKPLFNRDNTYLKFLSSNTWVTRYMINAVSSRAQRHKETMSKNALSILEPFAKRFQLWYMKDHRTSEIISDQMLAFHPRDHRGLVLNVFEKKLKHYDPPSLKLRKGHASEAHKV